MAAEKERNAEAGRTPPHVLVTGAAGFKGRRLTGSQGRRSGLPLLHALFYELTGRSRRTRQRERARLRRSNKSITRWRRCVLRRRHPPTALASTWR